MITYKIVEISTVTDEKIEEAVNEWVSKGWVFEQMQFAMRDASKRPAMAFMFFTRGADDHQPEKPPDKSNDNTDE